MSSTMIEFKNIQKEFPGVYALKDISFKIEKGEVHALLGENGAGKSTLLNILHGVFEATSGAVWIAGQPVHFSNTKEALEFGIAKVHQEINMVECLTVGQNIALGFESMKHGRLDYKEIYRKADHILEELGCNFKSADSIVGLSVGEMQMITIAKALYHDASIISFDEPTSALSNLETERLYQIIDSLIKRGITLLYISHKLDEIFRLADRASILRDGTYVTTVRMDQITKEELIRSMVGRDVSSYAVRQKPSCKTNEIAMRVENLCGAEFSNISFEVCKGEIVGFSGLFGAKRTEVMRAVFGVDKKTSGVVEIKGKSIEIKSPEHALKNGIGMISENRKSEGFIPTMSDEMNIAMASLDRYMAYQSLNGKKITDNFEKYASQVQLNNMNPDHLTINLSGGNQQKVILAKWLATDVDILIFDEPTKGVDVGAKAEIYSLMEAFVAKGKAIIMVSSELPEVIGMSDRIYIMKEGRMAGMLCKEEFSETELLGYAMGERSYE